MNSNDFATAPDASSVPLPSFLDAMAEAAEADRGPELDLSTTDLLANTDEDMPVEPETMAAAPIAAPATADAGLPVSGGYSVPDLELFRALTGYRLDTQSPIWRAVDDSGKRASIIDRLFTTLAEEAFRFADRQRRSGLLPDRDLTADDLALTLGPIRRAAAAIGSRGLGAFDRLEAAIRRLADRNFGHESHGMEIYLPG